MIEKSKNPSNCCKFCGWEFHQEIIQRIIENKEPVVCEFCGIIINVSNISPQEGFYEEKFEISSNSKEKGGKKKKSIVKNISKLIQPRKYSVGVIFGDDDFPKIFKENLIIVISRLIYVFIQEWEQDNNISVSRVSLERSIFYYIIKKIRHIYDKRVNVNFLNNLFRLDREDFEDWLRLLQKKLYLNKDYRTHFKFYLTWLIRIVFKLVSDMWDMKNLPKFQATILKDLKNYAFYSPNSINSPIKDLNIKPESNVKRETFYSKTNANELLLIYNSGSNSYELVELCNVQLNNNSHVIGIDKCGQSREIEIKDHLKYPNQLSYNITCKHGILSLSENQSLFTVDENLNIIKIPVKDVKEEMPILMPRNIDVIVDHSPLDLSNCGDVIEENGVQFVKKARTKAFRFVEKNYELGYILGHYCSEGSMNQVTISCGNQKAEMEKIRSLVKKNLGFTPSIGKHNKKGYETVYSVDSNTKLGKLIFTEGIGLKSKYAPFKEIPPFLYNAPTECVKGFLASFNRCDGSIEDRNRQDTPSRDISVNLFTSSRKLAFGLNFLLKRLGIIASINKREFDNLNHPTYYDAYTLSIKGKRNINILREFFPNLPEIGYFARDLEPVIDLNPWMKKINKELKESYVLSLRKLSEKGKIPYISARCSQNNCKTNISEAKALETLNFLKKNDYITNGVNKLCNIFEKHTITKVKAIEINNELDNAYDISIPYPGMYLAGIGQIYCAKNEKYSEETE